MRAYPDDPLEDILRNVFDFDVYKPEAMEFLLDVLNHHGYVFFLSLLFLFPLFTFVYLTIYPSTKYPLSHPSTSPSTHPHNYSILPYPLITDNSTTHPPLPLQPQNQPPRSPGNPPIGILEKTNQRDQVRA